MSLVNRQLHLQSKALFILEKLFIPMPPLLLSEHTVAQLTKEIFLSRSLPPKRTAFESFPIWHTLSEALGKEKDNRLGDWIGYYE